MIISQKKIIYSNDKIWVKKLFKGKNRKNYIRKPVTIW